VSDVNGAKWVGGFVRCTAGGAFQGRVVAGFSSMTGGYETWVVFGIVLLYTDSVGRFLFFAEFSMVAVTLAVTAVGG
jgi:hypothetical protein